MSGLETLPPDQRAVLQLILRQGRDYAGLAGLLKIDVAAVRDRALAGVEALGGVEGAQLAPGERARIADYLLGQQDDAERIVTLAELESSAAASSWARALHARIAPLASTPLPEVPAQGPAAPSPNGATAATVAPAAPEPQPAAPVAVAPAPAPPPPVAPPRPSAARSAPRPSRLGGAILLASVAALAVLLIVLLDNGGGSGSATKTSAAATTPATSAQTQAGTTPATTQPAATVVAQANLKATPAGGKAIGLGIAGRSAGNLTLALEAQHLPANGPKDYYGIWLQGPPGAKFLGFAPTQVRADGTLTVSAALPADFHSYRSVLVAHEPTTVATPRTPGLAVLSGNLTFAP